MAFAQHRMIEFDYEPGHKYPYVCVAWCEVGGMNVGDRFTEEVGDALIDYLKDEVRIVVNKPEENANDRA